AMDAGVGWIAGIIIGGIAGWLAEQFMKSDMGLLMNIVLGVVGAIKSNLGRTNMMIATDAAIPKATGTAIVAIAYALRGGACLQKRAACRLERYLRSGGQPCVRLAARIDFHLSPGRA